MSATVIDMHREVSLGLLKSTSAYAIRTPKGQKDPGHVRWDPKTNSPEESQRTIHLLERSNDNIGVHLHGKAIDVDTDTDNVFMLSALDHFLPPTAHVWGRKSRPRTHRFYETIGMEHFDPTQYPFLAAIQKIPALSVEIRGGEAKSGRYSLLPGSLHPSGEAYEWADLKAARSTPVTVDLARIVNGVRFACVAALIAPYWTEGVRNQLCMALSGFFHRAAAHVSDMGAMSQLYFERKDAKELMEGLIKIADDDEADYAMRMRTFDQTWDKADQGHPVQGASTIVKITGDESILPLLYTLLADTPDLIAFDRFLDRYAVRNGTSNIIDRARAGHRSASYIMTVNDFRNSNMHMTITTGTGDRRLMTNILLASTRAIRVEGLAFVPGGDDLIERGDSKFVNQWRGFEIPMYDKKVKDEDVILFLDYVDRILADSDKRVYEWILAWVADLFKFPANKPGTALVLVGKPGAGKSLLGEKVIRAIIGRNHSMQTNTVESLTGQFNQDSSNMLFIQCDEAMNSRRRSDANKMKSMITDRTRRIEPKGVNAFEVEDCARYCFTSNEDAEAVAIVDGQDDRRYSVFKVNEDYATNSTMDPAKKRSYWEKLHEWLEKEENLSKLHRYFYDYTYDRAILRRPLDTEARRKVQQHSQRGFDDWLMQIVSYEHPFENLQERDQKSEESYVNKAGKFVMSMDGWPDMVSYRRLEDSYEYYRKRKGMSGTTSSYNAQQIKQEFITRGILPKEPPSGRIDHSYELWKNGTPVVETKKIRVTAMPKRDAIANYLWEKFGFRVSHGDDISDNLAGQEPAEDKGPKY